MDKSYVVPYPQVDAKIDNDSVESRLNASREAIRLRMKTPAADQSNDQEDEPGHERPINSWSSLLMNMIAPSAKKAASRHPYTLIGGSAIIGAYLAWAKPWRGVLGSVIVGAVIRNLVSASVSAGSRNSGRILKHYLDRIPTKKYAPYQKHSQIHPGA